MALWNEVQKAARDARADRHQLLEHLGNVRRRILGTRPAPAPGEPPTLMVDGNGQFVQPPDLQGLRVLGRSLLLLAASAAAMALSWLTTWCLAAYLFLQRLLGFQVSVAGT
jgi:hypothetical protein